MDSLSIAELKEQLAGGLVNAATSGQIESATRKNTKQGKTFLELKVVDATDRLTLRIWEDSPAQDAASKLSERSFVQVQASWELTKFGPEPRDLQFSELTSDGVAELLEGPLHLREKQGQDFEAITEFVEGMEDPRLGGLCRLFLKEHGERFRRTAAAREYHHARRGGLVEHVAQMMRSAAAIATAYTYLNRDLLLAGVLFHDCGKLWENCYVENGFTMPYTEGGEMLGHIPVGIEVVNRLWRTLLEEHSTEDWRESSPPTDQVRMHLLHLIGSHHGSLEFGSPVLPKTPEAYVLHHVDNIDAKLEMIQDSYRLSQEVGPGIFERRRPLPAQLIRPLAKYSGVLKTPISAPETDSSE